MNHFKNNLGIPVLRQTRYCTWIREREANNARLIRLWIDPSMATFESHVNAPEFAATLAPNGLAGRDAGANGAETNQGQEEPEEIPLS